MAFYLYDPFSFVDDACFPEGDYDALTDDGYDYEEDDHLTSDNVPRQKSSFQLKVEEIRRMCSKDNGKSVNELINQGHAFVQSAGSMFSNQQPERKPYNPFVTFESFEFNQELENDYNPDSFDDEHLDFIEQQIELTRKEIQNGTFRGNLNEDRSCDFLKTEIEDLVRKLISGKPLSPSDAILIIDHNDEIFSDNESVHAIIENSTGLNKHLFELGFRKWLSNYKPNKLFLTAEEIHKHPREFRKIVSFDDTEATIESEVLNTFGIVYGPSGGGKSQNLAKNRNIFFDVDELIKLNYSSFEKFYSYCVSINNLDLMNFWFKYTYHQNVDLFKHKILLCNHPNQLPNCFKIRLNELIIMPKQLNWQCRWFSTNFFSLLSVKNTVTKFLEYDEYQDFILKFFKYEEFKYYVNNEDSEFTV